MVPNIPGYRLGASLEPPHPRCTISDEVYAAEGPAGRCVVKLLWLGFPLRDVAAERWLEVMGRLQTVSHPSIVRVLGAGVTDAYRPYYVMEHVDGETAAARAARGPTSGAEVSSILARVAEGIVAAHTLGYAPEAYLEHILLSPIGPRIWNLGVHRWRTWAQDLVRGTYVNGGQIVWHPNLTPHSLKGLPASLSNASAQLALIAFQLLAARPYWQADHDASSQVSDLFHELLANAGPPPSARSAVPLPAGFDAWFARCLGEQVGDPREAAATFPL